MTSVTEEFMRDRAQEVADRMGLGDNPAYVAMLPLFGMAYYEGAHAFSLGKKLHENPYQDSETQSMNEFRFWEFGWFQMEAWSKQTEEVNNNG